MNIDIIAYQDGVGVNHTALEDSARFYEILYKAHEKASRARLWADMELFYFEDGDGGNLLPADFNKRIIRQMENISPYPPYPIRLIGFLKITMLSPSFLTLIP